MYLLLLLFVTSTYGFFENCEIASEYCCNHPVDDGLREAEKGYDTKLTSLMDPEEGCRWIFKSSTTECCYSDRIHQCQNENHDKEKCRKNQTEFQVDPDYNHQSCHLQLFNIRYRDAGEYTQTTRTFSFTINLTVNRNRDWETPVISVVCTIFGMFALVLVFVLLRKRWMTIKWEKKRIETIKQEERENQKVERTNQGRAILGVLRDENEESFKIQSKNVDVLGAKDKDNNTLLHMLGMQYWSDRKTGMIHDYCDQKQLFEKLMDVEKQMLLQNSDRISKIVNIPAMNANIKETNNMDETPLHVAAKYGRIEVVKALLSNKEIDINAMDQHSWTPLHHAAFKNHIAVIQLLLGVSDIEIDAKANDDKTPLLCAGSEGKCEAFKILLKHGAQLNATSEDGKNILHFLSEKGNVNENEGKIEILQSILKQTEVISKISQERQLQLNPLLQAVYFESNQATVKSLPSSASVSASICGTPLEIAVLSGFIKAAKLLVENGANWRTKLDQNNKQLQLHLVLHAVLKGHKQFADLLLQKDPSLVNQTMDTNKSYLHVAVEELNLNAVNLFLNMNIDQKAKNSHGKTALELAEEILNNSLDKKKIQKIIQKLSKQRDDLDIKEILEKLKTCIEDKKKVHEKVKEIKDEKEHQTEEYLKQIKKLARDEKSLKKELKVLQGEEDIDENEQIDMKRENPTMGKIQNRVKEMIEADKNLTIGQMAQVLKILNDEDRSRSNTANRFLMPNSKKNRLSYLSD